MSMKIRDARALPEGTRLYRRYIVGPVLGIGGFGITYSGYDTKNEERVAIKEYFPAEWAVRTPPDKRIVPNSQSKKVTYRHGQEVFINEARVLSKLRDVRSIVNVKAVFGENGTAYMVMELLEGYTLSGYMRYQGLSRMPWKIAGNMIREVGEALHQVHRKQLLHRDIGPDNIMLTRDGKIRLIDFGSTRMYALNSAKSMSVFVKPGFAPIEQYSRSGNQGPWTDVYALAATYYFMVTGEKPPEAPDRITGVPVIPLKEKVPEIPEYISRAVNRALTEDWRGRTQNLFEFLAEMRLIHTAHLLMKNGQKYTKYYFAKGRTINIGRDPEKNDIVLEDMQVSGQHCKAWYDERSRQFMIKNYSGNQTYTSHGTLQKGQGIYLQKKDWFYIQTTYKRYIFYLEVE